MPATTKDIMTEDIAVQLSSHDVEQISTLFSSLGKLSSGAKESVNGSSDTDEVNKHARLLAVAQSDPTCEKVFDCWQRLRDKQVANSDVIAHNALCALLQESTVHSDMNAFGTRIAENLIDKSMRSLYRGLGAKAGGPIKAAMQLVCAIVSHSLPIANEFCLQFDFGLKALATIGQYKKENRPPARDFFVLFFLSIIRHQDEALLGKVVQGKLMGHVFEYLKFDPEWLQTALLHSLHTLILKKSVSRSLKLHIFPAQVLLQILGLVYQSKLPETVILKAKTLLHDLCCSSTRGICFPMKIYKPPRHQSEQISIPEKSRVQNPTILHFLLGVTEEYLSDSFVFDIVIKALSTCPDVLADYIAKNKLRLEPQLSMRWITFSSLITKLLSNPPPSVLCQGHTATFKYRIDSTIPESVTGNQMSRGLQSAQGLVVAHTLQILLSILKKLELQSSECDKLGTEIPDLSHFTTDLKHTLLEAAKTRLPEITLLISVWHKVFHGCFKGNEILSVGILKVLHLTFVLLPHVARTAKFNCAKLVLSFEELKLAPHSVQLALLDTLRACFSQFKWWLPLKHTKSTLFNIILRLHCAVERKEVKTSTKLLLLDLLGHSELFNNLVYEAHIWLDTCSDYPENVDILDTAVALCVSSPYKFLDDIRSFQTRRGDMSKNTWFSPLVPAFIQVIAEKQNDHFTEENQESHFIFQVLYRIFLTQKEPVNFFQFVLETVKRWDALNMECFGNLHNYISTWLSYLEPQTTFTADLTRKGAIINMTLKSFPLPACLWTDSSVRDKISVFDTPDVACLTELTDPSTWNDLKLHFCNLSFHALLENCCGSKHFRSTRILQILEEKLLENLTGACVRHLLLRLRLFCSIRDINRRQQKKSTGK
eukprot:m.190448 g.190448  ORF g.190448 m.190448 type:complete len:881 (-) comp15641_c0_seq6:6685-9327(-)